MGKPNVFHNLFRLKARDFIILLSFIVLLTGTVSFGQSPVISITIAVSPPYSSKIQDYTNQPNKLMATILNKSGKSQTIYLQGSVTGQGGIRVCTNPMYKPPAITVMPGVPFLMSMSNLQQVFDPNHLVFIGITKDQILNGNGLPEGDYVICLKAFDFQTNQLVSLDEPQCCSNYVTISDVEPPAVLSPVCGHDIIASDPQNILFTWSRPPNAPYPTNFQLKIIEVLPSDNNITEAMKSLSHPVFFAVSNNHTSYPLMPGDSKLVPGKKYAFAIIASDPLNHVTFKNNGMSEVCSFKYEKPVVIMPVPDTTKGITRPPAAIFPAFPKLTTIKGKLMYKYQDNVVQGSFPLADASIRLEVRYKLKVKGVDYYLHLTPYGGFALNEGTLLSETKTSATGNFTFQYSSSEMLGLIAENYMITVNGFFQTGDLYRDAIVVVENPHKEFYLNNYIGYVVLPGNTIDVGTLETAARSFKLTVKVKSPFSTMQEGEQDELFNMVKTLQGAQVYILRKPDFSYHLFPEKDGLPKPNLPEKMNGMNVIAQAESDANGEAVFNNIVWHHDPTFTYYIYVRMKDSDEDNYAMISDPDGTGSILDQPMPLNPDKPYSNKPDPSDVSDFPDFYQNFGYMSIVKEIKMASRFPAVLGQVIDEKENKPLKGATIKLIEHYQAQNNYQIAYPVTTGTYTYDRTNYFQQLNNLDNKLSKYSCPCSNWVTAITETQADGNFIFNDLAMLYSGAKYYNGGPHSMHGPSRSVFVSCDGFTSYFGDIKGGAGLRIGEKFYMPVILKSGADIKGRIIDAETKKGVYAYFRFLTDSIAEHTNSDGTFSGMPARKLPGQKQYIKIEAEGYITDTIAVTVGDQHTDLGDISIFSKKRRLIVRVVEEYTYHTIPGAQVDIVGVSYPCSEKHGSYYIQTYCPLSSRTDMQGIAQFGFENAGDDNNQFYTVRISMPEDQQRDYEPTTRSIKIPYSEKPVWLDINLMKATCMFGYVYAGKTDSSAVAGAMVYVESCGATQGSGQMIVTSTTTDATGKYLLRNVPLRTYPQVVRAVKSKSQFVGDSVSLVLNTANTGCLHWNFHLKVYDNMDITNLMGFPMYVTSLKETGSNGHAIITGAFFGLHSNNEFSVDPKTELRFVKIEIQPSQTLKNKKNIPVSSPVYPPVKTLENSMPVSVYNQFDATVLDQKIGIEVDKSSSVALFGAIKGTVKIFNTNFNVTGFTLPEVYLAIDTGALDSKMRIHVLNGDSTVQTPNNMPQGFYACDPQGKALSYSLPGFPNDADASLSGSLLKNDRLVLNTTLRTAIPSSSPPGTLQIALGDVLFKKNTNNVVNGTVPLSMPLGAWTLQSKDWKLNTTGLVLSNAVIKTGIDVRCENLGLNYYGLTSDKAIIHMDTLKLLGVKDIILPTTNKGMLKVTTPGYGIQWQLFASTGTGYPIAGYVQGLTAMDPDDQVKFTSVRLFSDGSQAFIIKPAKVRINHLLDFTPYDGGMTVYNNWFKIRGEYNLGFPNGDTQKDYLVVGNCKYDLQGNSLAYSLDNLDIIKFTHNNLVCRYPTTVFTDQLFVAHGTVEEPNELNPTTTTLTKSLSMTKIEIDTGVTIPFSNDNSRFFKNVIGDMSVTPQYTWSTFWFEGELRGLKAISEKPQRMKFIVDGTIEATDQQINVSEIGGFPGMKWTYDLQHSRMTGSCNFSQNLGGMSVNGLATCVMDNNGWYFQAGGQLAIPGLGNANLYGLFGDYSSVPPTISSGFGAWKCIPSDFQTHVSGFLISGGIMGPVISPVIIPAVLVNVEAGVDIGLNARVWMSFGGDANTYGIGVLAEGIAYFHADCEATCTSLDVEADMQYGIGGTYTTNGTYSVDGCASLGLTLKGSQCLGAMGVCCGSCCLDVDVLDVTLGAKVHYDNNNGISVGLQTSSCGDQCP